MRLRNTQKKDLFTTIKEHGFSPVQFELNEGVEQDPAMIQFSGGDYFFSVYCLLVQSSSPQWAIGVAPGVRSYRDSFQYGSWSAVLRALQSWLDRLREELDNPDPWIAFKNQPAPNFKTSTEQANTCLTYPEWEQIGAGLGEIRKLLLTTAKESNEAVALINQQVDTLIDSGKRMGRVDWFNQTVGALINIFISISLSPELQREIWGVLKCATAGVIHLLPVLVENGESLIRSIN